MDLKLRCEIIISKVQSHSDYFDKAWMNGQFRPHSYVELLSPQWTPNNHLERWHNRMKRITRKAHPNQYEVLELFQRE